jgi:hypothetical protein
MLKKEIYLRAFFKSYDSENKKLTMLFLDDEIEAFTKDFLNKYYSAAQNNPVKSQEFYVKWDKKSIAYVDKSGVCLVPVQELIDKVVNLCVYIKHYNFMSNGKKIQGWNINLVKINPA